jgi:hypothetical protein
MRIFSSAFLYGNKVIPFEQPILSANGVIGGDSFAVCGKKYRDTGLLSDAYKMFDGNSSTYIESALDFPGTNYIRCGIYNPNAIKVKSIDIVGSLSIGKPLSINIFATNDETKLLDAVNNRHLSGFEDLQSSFLEVTTNNYKLSISDTNKRYYKCFYIEFIDILNQGQHPLKINEMTINGAEKIKGV